MGENREVIYESKIREIIGQKRLKLESTIECLILYKTDMSEENRHYIERFFKSLKDLPEELKDLSAMGIEYERKIEMFSEVYSDTHEFFSVVLEGIARVRLELKRSELNLSRELKERYESLEDIKDWGREYTNMTSNGKILIVDDDVLILSVMNRALDMNGYEVIVTSKPYEVVDIVKGGNLDLAIVDVIMPGLDGFEVFENIRESVPELPVVFVTGKDHMETKIDALKRGVEDYIVKPFSVEEVLARIDRILKRSNDYKYNINIDEMTGACTRKCFASKIKQYLKNVKGGSRISLSFLDLDRFKEINDTYGHLIGDEILKNFVSQAKEHIRSSNIFRFGGDEFLVVIEDSSETEAKDLLEEFRVYINSINHRFEGIDHDINIGVSIGVTEIMPDDYTSGILDRADKALYKAKENGRNQLVMYSDISKYCEEAKKQVLIIDAENVASNLVKNRLKNLGYDVELADSIADIEQSLDRSLDLVIMDFKTYRDNKSCIDRLDVLKKKVLLMISENDKKILRPSDVFEIDEIIVKPVSVTEVEKKVRKMISQSIGE